MADPFSIINTSPGLTVSLWRCGSYLKELIKSAGKIDNDIRDLEHEIHALISANEALNEAYNAEKPRVLPGASLAGIDRVNSLWKSVGTVLNVCQKTVEELEEMMLDVIGRESTSTSKLGEKLGGKLDALKKTVRRERKDADFKEIRMKLVNYQNSLQILITALNLYGILSTSRYEYLL